MLSFLCLQRDFEEGNWLLAADFLSFFAAAICILVDLAFVLCQASTWPNRGVSHGHRQSNQRRVGSWRWMAVHCGGSEFPPWVWVASAHLSWMESVRSKWGRSAVYPPLLYRSGLRTAGKNAGGAVEGSTS